jgi:hypothetical protein
MAARIALVAFSRARSAWEAARRSRPPSPTARASSAARKSSSARALDALTGSLPGPRLLQLGPQLAQPGLVGRLCGGVQQRPGVAEVGARRQLAGLGPAPRARGRRSRGPAVGGLEVDGEQLPRRMGEEPGQVAKALGVLQADH